MQVIPQEQQQQIQHWQQYNTYILIKLNYALISSLYKIQTLTLHSHSLPPILLTSSYCHILKYIVFKAKEENKFI